MPATFHRIKESSGNAPVALFVHLRKSHALFSQKAQVVRKPGFLGSLLEHAAYVTSVTAILVSGGQNIVNTDRIPFVEQDLIDHLQKERIHLNPPGELDC
jgi:hypothetical protein